MAKRVKTSEGDGTIVGAHKWGVTIVLDQGGTVARSNEIRPNNYKEKLKPLGPNDYRIVENKNIQKSKILENKLRKMIREELMKESPSKRRFLSNIIDEWQTPEDITNDIYNYILEDSEFEHGASTAEIINAIQVAIKMAQRKIRK